MQHTGTSLTILIILQWKRNVNEIQPKFFRNFTEAFPKKKEHFRSYSRNIYNIWWANTIAAKMINNRHIFHDTIISQSDSYVNSKFGSRKMNEIGFYLHLIYKRQNHNQMPHQKDDWWYSFHDIIISQTDSHVKPKFVSKTSQIHLNFISNSSHDFG